MPSVVRHGPGSVSNTCHLLFSANDLLEHSLAQYSLLTRPNPRLPTLPFHTYTKPHCQSLCWATIVRWLVLLVNLRDLSITAHVCGACFDWV